MGRPSDSVVRGDACAPQRSLFYALGLTEEELNRPLIGVVSAYSEIVPGHLHLDLSLIHISLLYERFFVILLSSDA